LDFQEVEENIDDTIENTSNKIFNNINPNEDIKKENHDNHQNAECKILN